jgi:hypothetical protein
MSSCARQQTRAARVCYGSKADMTGPICHVRFTPKADIAGRHLDVRFVPLREQRQRGENRSYSITSSASTSRLCGSSIPSTLAVLRLMMRSNFVGSSTGMSLGLAPRRILSTSSAVRRNRPG